MFFASNVIPTTQAHVVASNNAMSVFAKAPKLHSPVLEDAMRIELEDAIAHKYVLGFD